MKTHSRDGESKSFGHLFGTIRGLDSTGDPQERERKPNYLTVRDRHNLHSEGGGSRLKAQVMVNG